MIRFQSFKPKSTLKEYIKCYWIIDGKNNIKEYKKTILPHVEVCISFLFIENKSKSVKEKEFTSAIYITPAKIKNYELKINGRFYFIDVSLHPGVFYEIFKISLSKLEKRSYNINELNIKFDEKVIDKININKDEEDKIIDILDDFFSKLCSKIIDEKIVDDIKKLTLSSNLNKFYNEINLSNRQIQRETKKITGLTPRTIQRISRFYKILNNLKTFDDINYSTLAQKLDFYDQSHLIKEFKYFSGENIKNFLITSKNYLQFESEEYCHQILKKD
ncbi:hypothetical protein CRV00_01300 [Malaciobacter molluscorum]|uniref:DUF6597 domain-containing transcriptional factor n=1 Tax=Malaciobacter molluscorum TaxID=1032072 RepID=UPI00100C312E|nr:DUF6597 domain-containing transcriptional factor [Malaciobacter molluscorum]RXJ97497.1 hypothetical protein CRV00_01300 [Malaciobacter molluscorum]